MQLPCALLGQSSKKNLPLKNFLIYFLSLILKISYISGSRTPHDPLPPQKKNPIFPKKKVGLIFSETETLTPPIPTPIKKSLDFRRELPEPQKQKKFYTFPYKEVRSSKSKCFLIIIINFYHHIAAFFVKILISFTSFFRKSFFIFLIIFS